MGDFNLKPDDKWLKQLLLDHNLYNLIKDPTCFKSIQGSMIDLILTNRKFSFKYTQTFETGISDHHMMIYTMLKTTFQKLPPKTLKYRDYKSFDETTFLSHLVHEISSIQPGDFSILNSCISKIIDQHAPVKTKLIRGNNKPHMNKELRKEMMKRAELKKKAHKTGLDCDKANFRKQRNKTTSLNRIAKKEHYKSLNPKDVETNKQFWKTFKPMFDSSAINGTKIILVEGDEIMANDLQIANTMNEYFANVTKTLDIKDYQPDIFSSDNIFTETTPDNIDFALNKFKHHPSILKIKGKNLNVDHFSFSHINPEVVRYHILKLETGKSVSGNIPISILKKSVDVVMSPLTDCFNNCINEGRFPNELKLADVSPILKPGISTDKTNYRPISVLVTISKVFERIMGDQLNAHFENILCDQLCGFRKSRNTQNSIFYLVEKIRKCLDKHGFAGAILMDLSKAYDCLPHDLLIAKLSAYGMSKESLRLLLDYLSNRRQRVKVNSSLSSWIEIFLGVPQGSVLGPILFNIFINDLMYHILDSEICNFADDNTPFTCAETIEVVIIRLEDEVDRMLQWFESNMLVANPGKFQAIFFGNGRKDFIVDMGISTVRSSNIVKLLGILIDNELSFDKHITNICTKANSKLKAFSRIRHELDYEQAKLLLNSFFFSSFNYCPLIWMFSGLGNNTQINRLHRRALQVMSNDFSADLRCLLEKENQKTIHKQNADKLAIEIYKIINGFTPQFLREFYVKKDATHSLRTNNLLHLPSTREKSILKGIDSLTFRGIQIWNKCSDTLKKCDSLKKFKKSISDSNVCLCNCRICQSMIYSGL